MIRVEDLSKKFVETKAVDDISFHVKKGEVVGFLGPNGAGKTTTMKIITCFMPPTEGTAKIAGMDIYEQSLDIRRRIGYLPETCPLYMDMGVMDYLKYIAEIRQIEPGQVKGRLEKVIESCALGSVIQKDINELSKGFRQRVGLAQALIHEPDIMILDEPTSGLDPNQIIEIRNLIKKIGQEKTVLLSTHILPEVEATCSRVIIINKGKIVAQGTPGELSASKQKDVVMVSIKADQADIEQKLSETNLVSAFTITDTTDGTHRLELKSTDKNICEEFFKFAVQNNWVLTELHQEAATLEDVFLHLTTQE